MQSQNTEMLCAGLMSGSSLDGLDIAVCRFRFLAEGNIEFELLEAATIEFPENLTAKLTSASEATAREISHTDALLGKWMGEKLRDFLASNQLRSDLAGSHGHTVFHDPASGFSTQIGHAAHVSAACGLPVVADFRMSDIACQGQGAPMIPIAEALLWPQYHGFINLGGIVNISFHQEQQVIAYDLCAGNQLLNFLAAKSGLPYDRDGILSASGQVIPSILQEYLSLDFFEREAPKSLANDWVRSAAIPIFDRADFEIKDLLVTAMEGAAHSIARSVQLHASHQDQPIMVSGGGAHHPVWVAAIDRQLKSAGHAGIFLPDASIINFKEAILMALAAYLRWHHKPNFIRSVTGADSSVSGGAIYLPAGYCTSQY